MSAELRLLGPLNLPSDPKDAIAYYNNIIREQWLVLKELQDSLLVPCFVAPSRPRDGMIRYADGTSWNPGSGKGLYQYQTNAWVKL